MLTSLLYGALIGFVLVLVAGIINVCVLPAIWTAISWAAQFGDMAIVVMMMLIAGVAMWSVASLDEWWNGRR